MDTDKIGIFKLEFTPSKNDLFVQVPSPCSVKSEHSFLNILEIIEIKSTFFISVLYMQPMNKVK